MRPKVHRGTENIICFVCGKFTECTTHSLDWYSVHRQVLVCLYLFGVFLLVGRHERLGIGIIQFLRCTPYASLWSTTNSVLQAPHLLLPRDIYQLYPSLYMEHEALSSSSHICWVRHWGFSGGSLWATKEVAMGFLQDWMGSHKERYDCRGARSYCRDER